MTEPSWGGPFPPARRTPAAPQPANLADLLERVLDKGIVIAGDIRVDLLDIELLTIRIRLLVASVDRAREMGIDWWEHDPSLSSGGRDLAAENRRLRRRIGELQELDDGQDDALDDGPDGRGPAEEGSAEEPPDGAEAPRRTRSASPRRSRSAPARPATKRTRKADPS
ncbi:gas vesicle protein [Kitasatospora sp. CM 4170]|uniref:Gas vesicle protein n=1 Tax=Kitasatospora aburaviensis TaxID=67265 RepID=A0ABW1F757_9ACTN|nr:gas vesicle protein [Kitasatospora sp. CM 4170]WNM43579.1 gas vesicle protein [Kitasatospora sp. CM 4170]